MKLLNSSITCERSHKIYEKQTNMKWLENHPKYAKHKNSTSMIDARFSCSNRKYATTSFHTNWAQKHCIPHLFSEKEHNKVYCSFLWTHFGERETDNSRTKEWNSIGICRENETGLIAAEVVPWSIIEFFFKRHSGLKFRIKKNLDYLFFFLLRLTLTDWFVDNPIVPQGLEVTGISACDHWLCNFKSPLCMQSVTFSTTEQKVRKNDHVCVVWGFAKV